MMNVRRMACVAVAAGLVMAACGSDSDGGGAADSTPAAADSTPAAGGDCVVGVSWNNYQEERWAKWDEPALKAAIEAGGGSYV